jgi:hypothetical protein
MKLQYLLEHFAVAVSAISNSAPFGGGKKK